MKFAMCTHLGLHHMFVDLDSARSRPRSRFPSRKGANHFFWSDMSDNLIPKTFVQNIPNMLDRVLILANITVTRSTRRISVVLLPSASPYFSVHTGLL